MRLKKSNKEAEQRQSAPRKTPQVQRLEAYRYHAARSSSEDRLNRGQDQSKRSILSHHITSAERLGTLLFVLVITSSLLYIFWLSTTPNVRFVANEKSLLTQDELVYEQAAKDILDNSLLSQSKLTINTVSLADQLSQKFPELANVSITIPLSGHRPLFELQPKQAAVLLTKNGSTYVIDDKGVVLLPLSQLTAEKQAALSDVPRVNDLSPLDVQNGQQILTAQMTSFLQQLTHQYSKSQEDIKQMEIPSNAPNEVHVIPTDASYKVKYIGLRAADEQFGAFVALKNELAGQGVTPSEYVDVRVESKVFYK